MYLYLKKKKVHVNNKLKNTFNKIKKKLYI